ncbi:hypothetical protein FUAX_38120 [Fulvitalea axinellae]|uniref:Glycosyl hydrolases family 43 n=1 Tax=Fulvitalea axinellae TaxID=1182444 RepID=A0AAU9DJI8_9BACT|nr:hypothetical protein FUAX_38120 [Fulvitalea axinellae]
MYGIKTRLCLSVLFALTLISPAWAQTFDFGEIKSPILFQGNYKYAYRDPAVVYHEGKFHLYFTLVEKAKDKGMYWYTAQSVSEDLVHWTYPKIITPCDRNLNYSSPGNIVRKDGQWIMCLQTYPTPNKERFGNKDSRVWIMRSEDLENWSEPELLKVKGNDVVVEDMGRMIDPYLLEDADEPGKWWCYYKQNGVSMSYSYDLKNWTYAGNAHSGENVTVIRQNGEYVLLHSPRNGIGVKRSKTPQEWGEDEALLTLGQKDWPWAKRRLTAATVVDLTKEKRFGKYIMFFHGSPVNPKNPRSDAHNKASLAIAWSDDLKTWTWPGKNSQPK